MSTSLRVSPTDRVQDSQVRIAELEVSFGSGNEVATELFQPQAVIVVVEFLQKEKHGRQDKERGTA
jgi:hypothetical protein